MSYNTMDHSGWMERNNAAYNRMNPKRKQLPETLTLFQKQVCDILGMVGGGIYNAPITHEKIEWNAGCGVSVLWRGSMATFDFNQLTLLVFLCHAARIRCDVSPANMQHVRFFFHARKADGGMAQRHPNLTEAIESFTSYLPVDHRILKARENVLADPAVATKETP